MPAGIIEVTGSYPGSRLTDYRFSWLQRGAGLSDASLTKMIQTHHPFIQNYFEYQDDLASLGNVVRIAVEHKNGDIFDAEFQKKLQEITDEVFFIPGVNRSGLRSLWTPNVRWMK